MADISWKKLACIGFISAASLISGCGNKEKVAVVDVQKLQQESVQIQAIQKEITDKNIEIQKRIDADAQTGIADEEMQKKLQDAQQERMIFMQSKQNQIKSLVESQCAVVAKEKNIGIVMHQKVVPAGAVDITAEVLAKMNGTASSGNKK